MRIFFSLFRRIVATDLAGPFYGKIPPCRGSSLISRQFINVILVPCSNY